MTTLRALTIRQPYASLILQGRKQYETRGWATSYRGPLLIHAAKRPIVGTLPTRALVGVAQLVDVVPTDGLIVSAEERTVGDFSSGRFAWQLADVEALTTPIDCGGKLGLWIPDRELLARLRALTTINL